MNFSGIEIASEAVPCVAEVRVVTEFKRPDVLFEFFLPTDPGRIRTGLLYQRIPIPFIGPL